MSFPLLHRKLDGSNLLVFLDMEGTEFSHEAIAIGIVGYEKRIGELLPVSEKPTFTYSSLIKAKNNIGRKVSELTGITKEELKAEGKDYLEVVRDITTLTRPYSDCTLYFGPLDIKILSATTNYANEMESNYLRHLKKKSVDFFTYLEERLVDSKGQPYGIARLGKKFSLTFEGKQHDPLYDALALSNIYFYIVSHEEELLEDYLKNYLQNPFTEETNKEVAKRILEGKTVDKETLAEILKENL